MTDDELVDGIIDRFHAFEDWDPWEDFKFAVSSGLETRYFLRQVRGALLMPDWPTDPIDVSPELEKRALDLLRIRALRECRLDDAPLPKARDETPYPIPNFGKSIKGGPSKRAGDIRKFTDDEIAATVDEVRNRYPALCEAIVTGLRHNQGSPSKVNVHAWTFDPLIHAVFHLRPDIDAIDNSELTRWIYQTIGQSGAEAL